jgi:hypothetical protein
MNKAPATKKTAKKTMMNKAPATKKTAKKTMMKKAPAVKKTARKPAAGAKLTAAAKKNVQAPTTAAGYTPYGVYKKSDAMEFRKNLLLVETHFGGLIMDAAPGSTTVGGAQIFGGLAGETVQGAHLLQFRNRRAEDFNVLVGPSRVAGAPLFAAKNGESFATIECGKGQKPQDIMEAAITRALEKEYITAFQAPVHSKKEWKFALEKKGKLGPIREHYVVATGVSLASLPASRKARYSKGMLRDEQVAADTTTQNPVLSRSAAPSGWVSR